MIKKIFMKKIRWYVGQEVSDQRLGNGVITDINIEKIYAITVNFENTREVYTLTGKFHLHAKYPCLSQKPHVPLEYEYEDDVKVGDVVYAKDGNLYCYGKVKTILPNNKYVIVTSVNERGEESYFYSDDVKLITN